MQTATTNRRLKHTINHAVAQCYGKKKDWRADNFHPEVIKEQEMGSLNRSYVQRGSALGGVTFKGSTDYTQLDEQSMYKRSMAGGNTPCKSRMDQISSNAANYYTEPGTGFQNLPADRWIHPQKQRL
jgi:hypothetical protein